MVSLAGQIDAPDRPPRACFGSYIVCGYCSYFPLTEAVYCIWVKTKLCSAYQLVQPETPLYFNTLLTSDVVQYPRGKK